MVDAALQSVIESVVNDKVQDGEMFTAYDVTKEVRNRGHRERHDNIKQVVHDYYGRGAMGPDYTRTLIPIAGAPIPAFLYHRHTDDPTTFNPRSKPQPASKSDPADVAAAVSGFYAQGQADPNTDDGSSDNGSGGGTSVLAPPASLPKLAAGTVKRARKPDARGTVCIPAKYLRACGFKPKDKVAVWTKDGSTLVVQKPTTTNAGKPLASYTVDVNNNVRVTKAPLQTIATPPSGGYDFEDTGKEILVKAR